MPAGAEDWDNDGQPGIAYNVSGLGSRSVVQRDWNEFFSDDMNPVPLSAAEFTVRADFDNQEQILATSGTLGGLLKAGSAPASNLRHRVVFRRLGKSESDAAVMAIHGSDELQTCFKVQDALPHDSASQ
jgi:hypothetical protein